MVSDGTTLLLIQQSFLADFPAPLSAGPENEKVRQIPAGYGLNFPESLAAFDPVSCSWKMPMKSAPLFETKDGSSLLPPPSESLLTLPRWGTTVHGELFRLPPLALPTNGLAGGAWLTPTATNAHQGLNSTNNAGRPLLPMQMARYPTPTKSDGDGSRKLPSPSRIAFTKQGTPRYRATNGQQSFMRLSQAVQVSPWATPVRSDYRRQGSAGDLRRKSPGVPAQIRYATPNARDYKGQTARSWTQQRSLPNDLKSNKSDRRESPTWAESCLMGFPVGWSELRVSNDGLHRLGCNPTRLSLIALLMTHSAGKIVLKRLVMRYVCLWYGLLRSRYGRRLMRRRSHDRTTNRRHYRRNPVVG